MVEKNSYNRRKVLQLAGIAGSGMLTSGLASASSGTSDNYESDTKPESNFYDKLTVADGRVTTAGSVSAKDNGSGPTPSHIAQVINEGAEKGYWEPTKKDDKVFVELTPYGQATFRQLQNKHGVRNRVRKRRKKSEIRAGSDEVSSITVSTSGCDGVTKYTDNGVWFSSEDVPTVAEAVNDVSDITGLVAIMSGLLGIAGAAPAILFGAASFLLGDYSGDLERADNGCGVKVTNYWFVSWDVDPQDCNC